MLSDSLFSILDFSWISSSSIASC